MCQVEAHRVLRTPPLIFGKAKPGVIFNPTDEALWAQPETGIIRYT